jgi:hypothetical protein
MATNITQRALIAKHRTAVHGSSKRISARRQEKIDKAASRVVCGATRHRDGQPCEALSEPGKRRCRFHGGRSTGPTSAEGKAKVAANLRRGRAKR